LLGTYVVMSSAVGVSIFYKRHLATALKRVKRMAKAEGLLKLLQLEHPELVALQTAMELVHDEKQEVSGRRDFWASA